MKEKLPEWLEEAMAKDPHLGVSRLPSDNLSPLDLDDEDWPWIDAIHLVEANRDPTRLCELLAQGPVPPAVLPFLTALLQARLGRKGGRPSILPTWQAIYYHAAAMQVNELVAGGATVNAAAKLVAPQWKLTAKALADYCYARRRT